MKWNSDLKPYLDGRTFECVLKVDIADRKAPLTDSISFLKAFCVGRRVIHVGAVDHLDSIDRKIAKGNWLHRNLMDVSARCVGIDINRQGVDYLKEKYAISDLYCADILADGLDFLGGEKWDAVLLPDVLEHIPDVFSFLKTLHDRLAGRCEQLLVAVPNAFCLRNFTNAFFAGREKINSDHRYWFTPYTLAKLLTEAGFEPTELHYVMRGLKHGGWKVETLFKNGLFKSKPCLRDTLILVGKF